ncbi:cystathionine gamma-synthase [Nesterenkonia sp. AN1]|uniref:trans-sulfuration enzyme family protein n=1 Tax=Nesterenkonia sp. AN1 TaxID=652017 RepID=UPI0004479236|nr:PLP-dependent transferase [Nesterenkonia sp. AN1]EXF24281.1 cystathionine gamma-synthase [Nesterenkonia sp. AN1]
MNQHERTFVVNAGRGPHGPNQPVNMPVDFTSTYSYRPGVHAAQDYAREGMPSWEPLEELLAQLEAGTRTTSQSQGLVTTAEEHPVQVLPGLLFSSGMAAISAVVQLLPLGGHLIMPRHSYMGFSALAQQMADQGLLTLHRVDIADTEQVTSTLHDVSTLASAQDDMVMLWVESPTNPMLEIADLPAVLTAAKKRGVLTAVDNTFATPLRQRPLKHGADVVVHSVTKFLSGHSDLIMGVAITGDPEIHARLHQHRTLHGAIPGPMEVFLALRGVRTLAVRLDASESSAGELARRLDELSQDAGLPLRKVNYPGLAAHPQHQRAAEQLGGFGAILTIELDADQPDPAEEARTADQPGPAGDLGPAGAPETGRRISNQRSEAEVADAVLSALTLWTPATSLGGVESLAERRRRHPGEPSSVPDGLIRLSVGIEDVEDLFADLLNALRTAATGEPIR